MRLRPTAGPRQSCSTPDARRAFSGVWSGTELIIWGGGVTGFGPSITGGRFNPTTNTWTETSLVNAPSAREWHSAVWTGSEMIVWGGCLDGSCGATLNTGALQSGQPHLDCDQYGRRRVVATHIPAVWTGNGNDRLGRPACDEHRCALQSRNEYLDSDHPERRTQRTLGKCGRMDW